jgi:hypothetical protein
MKFLQLTFALSTLLAMTSLPQVAQAHPTRIGIGINLFPPIYVGPGPYHYHHHHPYPYRYAYPYYYAPPAVIVQAPPIVVGSAPAVTQSPAPVVVEAPPAFNAIPSAPSVVPVRNDPPTRMDMLLQQLSDPNESLRRDAALDLGRMKAQRAVDPLVHLLSKDTSPQVREAAARGLGLIGSSRSLNALIYAAQADNDRDVRHTAQFAVEVIRTNLRGN